MKKSTKKSSKPKAVPAKEEPTINILAREVIRMSKKLDEIDSIVEKLRGRMGVWQKNKKY